MVKGKDIGDIASDIRGSRGSSGKDKGAAVVPGGDNVGS